MKFAEIDQPELCCFWDHVLVIKHDLRKTAQTLLLGICIKTKPVLTDPE